MEHILFHALPFDERSFTATLDDDWIGGRHWLAKLLYMGGMLALVGNNWLLPPPFHLNRNFNPITASEIIIDKPWTL